MQIQGYSKSLNPHTLIKMSEKAVNCQTTVDDDSGSTKPIIAEKYADVTLQFVERYSNFTPPLTDREKSILSRKLFWYIILLLSFTNLLLFVCTFSSGISLKKLQNIVYLPEAMPIDRQSYPCLCVSTGNLRRDSY